MTALKPPYAIIPDEAELGVQKRCPSCEQWWPAHDPTFWRRQRRDGRPGWASWCLACLSDVRAERHRRSKAA